MGEFHNQEPPFPNDDVLGPQPSKGYGLSGKIMLSAIVILFSVVIIMICLHIYARWYILRSRRRHLRRRTHLVFYVEPNNPSSITPFPHRGLDPTLLNSLPTFSFHVADAEKERESGHLECAVCLSEFEEGEKGRVLPKCGHSFHVGCIDMWFHSHATCPICRAAVERGDLKVAETASGEVVIELSELTRSELNESNESNCPRPTELRGCSTSNGGRRKGLDLVGVRIEVPRRSESFSFTNSDESGRSPSPSQGFKSPTGRLLSLKRILSREKRSPLPSTSDVGTSTWAELDNELERVEKTS